MNNIHLYIKNGVLHFEHIRKWYVSLSDNAVGKPQTKNDITRITDLDILHCESLITSQVFT